MTRNGYPGKEPRRRNTDFGKIILASLNKKSNAIVKHPIAHRGGPSEKVND